MRTIWGYCRVSTNAQCADGNSLATQKTLIEQYIARAKLVGAVKFVTDVDSASKIKTAQRAGWSAMTMTPGDAVVAVRMDRIFRSTADAATTIDSLQKQKVELHFCEQGIVGNGSTQNLTFNLLASVAQFESELKSARISEVKKHMKSAGLFLGGTRETGTTRGEGKKLQTNCDDVKILKIIAQFKKKRDAELLESKRKRAGVFTLKNLQKKIKRASSSDISGRWSEGFLWGLVNGKIEEKLTRVSQLG